jgi:hypothetical protein
MEHIYNNLMKLGGSLGNVPQKLKKKKLVTKTRYILDWLVHFQEYNLYSI